MYSTPLGATCNDLMCNNAVRSECIDDEARRFASAMYACKHGIDHSPRDLLSMTRAGSVTNEGGFKLKTPRASKAKLADLVTLYLAHMGLYLLGLRQRRALGRFGEQPDGDGVSFSGKL